MLRITDLSLAGVLCLTAVAAHAALPAPTPEQRAAGAAKKAAADAQALLDQQALLGTMDAIAARWRANARVHGWAVYKPVPVPAPIAALKAPANAGQAPVAAPAPAMKGKP
ncbi:hypothetical protein [Massilia sp. TWP1-3-3]|uniref:hypothetical protein n=1 Tax=Massilia sp. TWP1-3-3 TaxID=2804573 RepID=UPI003CF033F5